jgi:hypothetical protein
VPFGMNYHAHAVTTVIPSIYTCIRFVVLHMVILGTSRINIINKDRGYWLLKKQTMKK